VLHSFFTQPRAAAHLAAAWTFASAATLGLVTGVFWQYLGLIAVFLIGLVVILKTEIPGARGLDAFLPFSRVFYCAPVAAFGTEHFVFAKGMTGMIPNYLPFHMFWVIFCGVCLIVGALAVVLKIQDALAATLLGIMFFSFDAMLTFPAIPQELHNRIVWALGFRELQFSAGALAYAGYLYGTRSGSNAKSGPHGLVTYARYVIGAGVLFFGVMQILHPTNVPCVPLEKFTPASIPLHGQWGYLCGLIFVACGICILLNRMAREAAAAAGIVTLLMLLFVYAPILYLQRGDIESFNYFADSMMYAGSVLLLANSLPKGQSKEGHAHA
jgi:uncharacterized membrane protein